MKFAALTGIVCAVFAAGGKITSVSLTFPSRGPLQ